MKQTRYLLFILIVLITAIILTGCASDVRATSSSQFVIVESCGDFYTVYHKSTKVMYAISNGTYNKGSVTLLVDAEGKPLLYEE